MARDAATPHRRRVKKILLWTVSAIVVVILAVLAAIILPIITHQNVGSSGQEPGSTDAFETGVAARGADGRTRSIEAASADGSPLDLSALVPGQELVLYGSGYDAGLGIYVGFCKIPDRGEKPSPCLGGIPEGAEEGAAAPSAHGKSAADEDGLGPALESQWITNNWAWQPFATASYSDGENGAFSVKLVVPPASSEGLDCRTEQCGIFTRNDHTAAGDRVQDLYLRFSYAAE